MQSVLHSMTISRKTGLTNQPSRRDFLQDCGRGAILAGLAVLGAVLGLRKGDPAAAGSCLKQRVCRGCGLYDHCSLPQAEATRKQNS
jgi:hypothetical protein